MKPYINIYIIYIFTYIFSHDPKGPNIVMSWAEKTLPATIQSPVKQKKKLLLK